MLAWLNKVYHHHHQLRVCESASCESASCESASCESASCESVSCESASCESASCEFTVGIYCLENAHLSVILCDLTN
jgi:hypothetical protein